MIKKSCWIENLAEQREKVRMQEHNASTLGNEIAFKDDAGGIGGAFFRSISSCVAITLLAPLSVELKTKAPGARTFLQVIRTRFGTTVHIIYCVCAISVNLTMMFEVSSSMLAYAFILISKKTDQNKTPDSV
ncbi:unnamed protein product [Rodentolepis nana]|uniref:NifU_N domain-containing protein n=1 Tax=Rodentolepis nana TaxID=102285 RepID=A0A0R3TD36_RODNA|nr:unnamed protein product [Rodentolepis nana]